MKYIKGIGIPIGFLCGYLLCGNVLSYLLSDAILATVFADVLFAFLGFCYYRTHFPTVISQFSGRVVLLSCGFLFVIWFISQATSTWVYQLFGDVLFDAQRVQIQQSPMLYLVLTVVLAPVTEEILMRGILFRHLKEIFSIGLAYLLSAVVFAILHGNLLQFIIGCICGIFFAMVYDYTEKLEYSILVHCLYNLLTVFCGGIALPDWFFTAWVLIPLNFAIFAFFIVGRTRIHQLHKNDDLGHSSTSQDDIKKLDSCKFDSCLCVNDLLCYFDDALVLSLLEKDALSSAFDGTVKQFREMAPEELKQRKIVSPDGIQLYTGDWVAETGQSFSHYPYLLICVERCI